MHTNSPFTFLTQTHKQAGLYFITICVKNRLCLFDNIIGMNQHVGADLGVCPDANNVNTIPIEGEHMGSPLHRVMQWFKTMTTNEYIRGVKNLGWQPFDEK